MYLPPNQVKKTTHVLEGPVGCGRSPRLSVSSSSSSSCEKGATVGAISGGNWGSLASLALIAERCSDDIV